MKILIISLEYSPEISGGVGTHVQELSAGLSQIGNQVTVLACTFGTEQTILERNRTIYLIPPDISSIGPNVSALSIAQGILALNARLAAYVRSRILPECGNPDLIQCYNWVTFQAAYELGRDLCVPVVSTIQFVSEPVERFWGQTPDPDIVHLERNAFRMADMLITVSNSMKAIVQATHGIADHKIQMVHNGMDVNAFAHTHVTHGQLETVREQLAPSGEKLVLFAGRLNPQKGISAILSSIAPVVHEYPHTRYVFAGEPDSRQLSEWLNGMLTQNHMLKKRVVLLGKLSRRRLAVLYQIADVALVPSVYEPFGYAAIEAMAAGVPLIATAAGGLAEIVTHEETGLLVPVHTTSESMHVVDVSALIAATKRLLGDTSFGRELAVTAHERVRSMFDQQSMTMSTQKVYESVVRTCQSYMH